MVDVKKRKRRLINFDEDAEFGNALETNEPASDVEIYAKEVLNTLIADNLPPTPNNFSLYFDRLLENKSENLRKQILSMLELEDNNDDENTIMLEQSLKQGFGSVKGILTVTASLFKNMSLMSKILEKRRNELLTNSDSQSAIRTAKALENDVLKLNEIIKKQSAQMKSHYEDTAGIFKKVEGETIFDNKYGVYNKRYLIEKISKEQKLIKEFKHNSSLIMLELSRDLIADVHSEKATILMTRTIARLLLKTSRRSDIVAHYGDGVFSMLLKHTDLENAIKTSDRLVDLVSSSNFFLADREIKLKVSIGITDVDTDSTSQEIIVSALNAIQKAYDIDDVDYAISLRSDEMKDL
ncbi:MAG: GGDEF domain-containing protein [Campylobacterales bacterium]|nr:GGDEF domain-containing protein [Campylobacterales bacterium]